MRISGFVIGALLVGTRVRAQARVDTARCDSIVAAARVDSVPTKLSVAATRMDGPDLTAPQREKLLSTIVASFLPPTPFRLTVFSGGAQMRSLRPHDTQRAELRAPVVTARYRVYSSKGGDSLRVALVRSSLMPGFDEAAEHAILSLRGTGAVSPPRDVDSMVVDIRFSSETTRAGRDFIEARFPRMPVVDAIPALDNPAPGFPEDERADGAVAGEVVFLFVVARSGSPAMETVEVLRATSMSFVRSALLALSRQRFTPATIHGCPVAQQIEYPMMFMLPSAPRDTTSGMDGAARRGGIDDDAIAGP